MKNKKKNNLYKKLLKRKFGVEKLGLIGKDGEKIQRDYYLSRYKFVSKLLNGKNEVLEIGLWGDGWYSRIVKQSVKSSTISDVDEVFLNSAKSREKIGDLNT